MAQRNTTQHHNQDLLNPSSPPRSFTAVCAGKEIWGQSDT